MSTGFCSDTTFAANATGCVTPVTKFADYTLNNIFTSIFGYMVIIVLFFLCSLCVINKVRYIAYFWEYVSSADRFCFALLSVMRRNDSERSMRSVVDVDSSKFFPAPLYLSTASRFSTMGKEDPIHPVASSFVSNNSNQYKSFPPFSAHNQAHP